MAEPKNKQITKPALEDKQGRELNEKDLEKAAGGISPAAPTPVPIPYPNTSK